MLAVPQAPAEPMAKRGPVAPCRAAVLAGPMPVPAVLVRVAWAAAVLVAQAAMLAREEDE